MTKDSYSVSNFSESPTYIETEKKIKKILKNKIPSETDRINLLYDIIIKEIGSLLTREDVRANKPYLEAAKTLLQTYTYTLLTLINKDMDSAIDFSNEAKKRLTEKYSGHEMKWGRQKEIE